MSTIRDAIQDKCLAFSDRIIKLNDFLLEAAANKKPVKVYIGLICFIAMVILMTSSITASMLIVRS